jgi:hypothetical protein
MKNFGVELNNLQFSQEQNLALIDFTEYKRCLYSGKTLRHYLS